MTRKIMNAIVVKHAVCVLLALFGASMLSASEIAVSDFSAICGWSTNAVVCAVGDTVALPAGEYTVNNPRVASISGNTVTALEPGFTGVIDSGSNVGGIIVRPAVGGSGRVFVASLDTDTLLAHTGVVQLNWCDENSWLCIDGGGGYPNAADDVAIIPGAIGEGGNNTQLDYSGNVLTLDGDVVVGQIFVGACKAENANFRLLPTKNNDARLSFSRTDALAPILAISGGNAAARKQTWVRFKANSGKKVSLDISEGLVVDLGCSDESDGAPHCFFQEGSLSIPSGKNLVFVNGSPNDGGTSDGTEFGIQFAANFVLSGQGVIRNDSDMNLRVNSEGDAIFIGSWESGGKRGRTLGAAPMGAGIDFRKASAAGCTAVSDGAFSIESDWGASSANHFQNFGSGGIKIGSGSNLSNTGLSYYGDRMRMVGHIILNSGLLGIWPEYGATQPEDIITTRVDRITFGLGLSKLYCYGSTSSSLPTNFVDIVSVVHQNRAQAYVYQSDFWNSSGSASVDKGPEKVVTRFIGAANLATNGVIPWMSIIARKKGLLPARVDGNGFLYTEARTDGVRLSAATPGSDALVHSASLSLTEDQTVNSLSVGSTNNKDQFLGADRMLTITSGALYLWDNSSIVGVEGGDKNGRIVFAAPGYVHTIVKTNTCAQINLPLVAAQGIAFGAPGGVRVTGDQTGIEQELAVNGCRLVLGTATTAAQLDVDIRVAAGYSVLDVQNVNANFLKNHKLTLQDSGNFPAKVNLAAGTYRVDQMYIAGKKMRSGTYGSTASGADNVDDDHFSGEGTILVASGAGLSIFVR